MIGAGAGVFEEGAARALVEVEVEFCDDRLGFRGCLDLEDGGDVHAGGERVFGDEDAVIFLEGDAGRGAAFAADDGDPLGGRGDRFVVVVEEGDPDLAVLGDEELGADES